MKIQTATPMGRFKYLAIRTVKQLKKVKIDIGIALVSQPQQKIQHTIWLCVAL